MDIDEKLNFAEMYDSLRGLRYIETKLAPLSPIFSAHREVLTKLDSMKDDLREARIISEEQASRTRETLDNYRSKIGAFDRNAEFLLSRIRSTTQLVSDTIALKSQNTSEDMSDHMLKDSTTIRVITLVTLVYLPSSFVAVSMRFVSCPPG